VKSRCAAPAVLDQTPSLTPATSLSKAHTLPQKRARPSTASASYRVQIPRQFLRDRGLPPFAVQPDAKGFLTPIIAIRARAICRASHTIAFVCGSSSAGEPSTSWDPHAVGKFGREQYKERWSPTVGSQILTLVAPNDATFRLGSSVIDRFGNPLSQCIQPVSGQRYDN
jgi:hypothetical protein